MRCVSVASVSKVERKSPAQSRGWKATAAKNGISVPRHLYADFCNKICQKLLFLLLAHAFRLTLNFVGRYLDEIDKGPQWRRHKPPSRVIDSRWAASLRRIWANFIDALLMKRAS
jgi:hypothetical protein